MTDAFVDRFLELRRGPDHVDGTTDDMQFKTPEDVRNAFGYSPEQFKQFSGMLGFKDQVYRVVSVGKSSGARRTVQLVFRRAGNVPQLITWKEF
jgi:hypothetical protein